jgi:N-acyl-D-amino-acid deacylase
VNPATFDLLFQNARVMDGSGAPSFHADVGIVGDRIAAVGPLSGAPAARRIDVSGKVVCPGFIDVHVHSELDLLSGAASEARIRQGITTDVMSSDGFSLASLSPVRMAEMCDYLAPFYGPRRPSWNWRTYAEYLERFDRRVALNVLPQVPFNTLRTEAVGWEARPATHDELEKMKTMAREMMEAGATGLQLGLDYYPGAHASTGEITAVAEVVAQYGGLVSCHLRSYGRHPKEAVEEMVSVARGSGAPIHFSHFFDCERIDALRRDGVDVTFDAYPYMAGCTSLLFYLPPCLQTGSPAQILARFADPHERDLYRAEATAHLTRGPNSLNDLVFASLSTPENQRLLGKTLSQAISESGKAAFDFVADLLVRERLTPLLISHWRNEERLRGALTHPLHMVSSDGVFQGGRPHPRAYGAFPKMLREAVRERRWLSLQDAVRKMTSLPAVRYRLRNRGLIRPGMAADAVVFAPDTIADRATYEDGRQYAEGVEYVAVNGRLVLDGGRMTEERPGRVVGTRA